MSMTVSNSKHTAPSFGSYLEVTRAAAERLAKVTANPQGIAEQIKEAGMKLKGQVHSDGVILDIDYNTDRWMCGQLTYVTEKGEELKDVADSQHIGNYCGNTIIDFVNDMRKKFAPHLFQKQNEIEVVDILGGLVKTN